jgi:ABC-type phosphate transport system substrate-binding protein
MFGIKRKAATVGIRASLLVGASIAALSLVSVGTAAAAPSCTGGNIKGAGSSLQKEAQISVLNPGFNAEACPSGPTVTYESTSSGKGVALWSGGKISTSVQYVGTDDAPTPATIEKIRNGAVEPSKVGVLVIPVAQTAIAIPANPPAGCTVGAITNADLEKVFRGILLNWSELATAEGSCASPITRLVREEGSGTTYQFKNYLAQINSASLPCVNQTWKELEPIEEGEKPNTVWPESCAGKTLSPLVHSGKSGGGGLVEEVDATSGSIAYAALPDAKGKSAPVILSLQNNGTTNAGATFGSPEASGASANCSVISYKVPTLGQNKVGNTGENVDWSQVFGARPKIGGSAYPLCTLTYDLSLHGYQAAGFASSKGEKTAFDYLKEYAVKVKTGQERLVNSGHYYAGLPSSSVKENNVLEAAQFAASKISY